MTFYFYIYSNLGSSLSISEYHCSLLVQLLSGMSAGHTVVTNFLLLILSICILAHQPTQEVQRDQDSSQNKLLTPNLTLDEDKQCGEENRKGVERVYRQCQ